MLQSFQLPAIYPKDENMYQQENLYMHIYSSFTQIILKAKSTPNASNGE
jgi:hypothetical protein